MKKNKEANNFIPEEVLNSIIIRKKRTEERNCLLLQDIHNNNKIDRNIVRANINIRKEITINNGTLSDLFREDLHFAYYYNVLEYYFYKVFSLLDIKKLIAIDAKIKKNPRYIPSFEIKEEEQIYYSIFQIKDYIFNCMIINFSKPKYRNFNFKNFLNTYKNLLNRKKTPNPLFFDVFSAVLIFIDSYFIKKTYLKPPSFDKNTRIHNKKLMEKYNSYFKNSIPLSPKDFIYKDLSNYSLNFFNSLNVEKDSFEEKMKESYDNINSIFLDVFSNNFNEENNKETNYEKRISLIFSHSNHSLGFITQMVIKKDEKKIFVMLKNALNHAIFIEALLLQSSKKQKIPIKHNLTKDELYVSLLVIELQKDYNKKFTHIIFLFISHYLGIPKSKSLKIANFCLCSGGECVNKKTYFKYYDKLKIHIDRIRKYFFDNTICEDLISKYGLSKEEVS
ncbi:hypothetical protein CSA08_04335 [Candidatus Gracilibacteria bacterium]|nr:MAG: hypothetical protein CSA08_04335 [Candidatus Gracilibacteria bacterium]